MVPTLTVWGATPVQATSLVGVLVQPLDVSKWRMKQLNLEQVVLLAPQQC